MIRWLDIIDQTELQALAKSYDLQLTYPTRSFLESFARLVNKASTTRQRLVVAAQARKIDLHTVNVVVAGEVSSLQERYRQARIIPYRHPETTLPIVYVRLQAVPDLVVHIYRSYASTRRGLAFGFRAYSFCRGQLSGALARATNYLRARCTANSWNLSLSELISLWCQQVDAIPIQERRPASRPSKSQNMFRRRRLDRRPSPPPLVSDNTHHASIPQTHPKTDVVIKDDKLFPNRTFDDPEQLYAEQVRAIRKKRKSTPGVLDDYELAKKRRRPEHHDEHPSEQTPPSPPQPSSAPLPQPPVANRRSLFPFQSPSARASEAAAQEQLPLKQPEEPEVPEFSFHNPLSPETKDSGVGETPRSPPSTEAQMEKTGAAEYDTARMEAAERAVSSKPAPTKDSVSSQPLDAETSSCTPDDSTPSLFFFSTGMDTHVLPDADDARAATVVTEEDRPRDAERQPVTPSFSERMGETAVVAPPEAEQTEEVASPPNVTPRSQEDGETMLSMEEEDSKSGVDNKGSAAGPSFAFTGWIGGKVDKGEDNVDISRTPGEENDVETDLNGPKDSSVQELDDSKTVLPASKSVIEKPESAETTDGFSTHETDPAGTRTPLSTDGAKEELATGDDPGEEAMEGTKVGLEPAAAKESRKRNREISCADDVIIVDPDFEEEKGKTLKKRRLSLTPPRNQTLPVAKENASSGISRLENNESRERDQERMAGSDTKGEGGAAPVQEPKKPADAHSPQKLERAVERPSPRHVSVWAPERSVPSPNTRGNEKDAKERREAKSAEDVGPSTAKKVTRHVEKDPRPFSGVGALSIPAGVDRDPCPMALSEPSESSEYSSDRDSNSDPGSISDGEPNVDEA